MFQTNANIVKIKSACQQFRKIINFMITLMLVAAFIYFLYYQLVVNDNWHTFDNTKPYFLYIPNLFMPDDTSDQVFLYTTFYLIGCTLPIIALYYITDYVKDYLIKICLAAEDMETKKQEKIAKKNELLQYEVIKYISICLAFDWDAEEKLAEEAKNKLNTNLYSKIKNALNANPLKKTIWSNKTLVIKSESFKDFDSLFGTLIRIIAKIKSQIEVNDVIEMIPTIYVDAYVEPEKYENIEKNYLNIMKFNLTNKALSSSLFVKKYSFMQYKKYKGYSIGDYSSFEGKSPECFEINVIYDNLNEILYSINER